MNDVVPAAAELVEGEVIETDDLVRARTLHNCIVCDSLIVKKKIFDVCVNLSIIRDDHLYTLLGYTSFKEYCLQALNYSLSTAKEYRVVGSFLRVMREGDARDLDDLDLDELGVKKLYMIAKLPAAEFQRLRESLDQPDDIYTLSTRDLRRRVSDLRAGVKLEGREEPKQQPPPPAPAVDPVVGQWVSMCLQLRSLVDQMDSFVFSNPEKIKDCEVKLYFNRVRAALVRDLKEFGGN